MVKDPVVEEIRKIRGEIEKEYGNDSHKYLEHIYEEQNKHKDKVVSRNPRKIQKSKAA